MVMGRAESLAAHHHQDCWGLLLDYAAFTSGDTFRL